MDKPGIFKGMARTAKTLVSRTGVVQYPHEKRDLAPRARGVIALKEENCTVCMLCARECPVWCIFIEGYKDQGPPRREGGKPRLAQKLDRFDIDYSLCMYCGICVDVCPFDALFWSPEFEYSAPHISDLLHDKKRLGDWMEVVPEKPLLDEGAEVKAPRAERPARKSAEAKPKEVEPESAAEPPADNKPTPAPDAETPPAEGQGQ